MRTVLAGRQRVSPLANPAFRRLWLASVLSAAGDGASWVALASLTLARHGSLPLLAVLYTAPVAAGGLAAGWALDRFNRRKLLMADAMMRGALFGAIPLTALAGSAGPGQLYLTAAVYGLLKMISLAGFPTLIPGLVRDDQLAAANALEGAGFGVAMVAGPALAGVALGAGLSPVAVIAADAATYLVFAWTLAVTPAIQAISLAGQRSAFHATMRDVVKLVAGHRVIRATTVMFALFNVGEGALLVLLARQADRVGLGPGGYGWLVAAMAAGECAATLVLLRVRWRARLTVSIVVAQLAAAAVTAGLLPPQRLAPLASLVALGCCTAPMTAWAQTLRMRIAPPQLHGRLFALLRTVMQATPPVGAALAAVALRGSSQTAITGIVAVMAIPALLFAPGLLKPSRVQAGDPAVHPASSSRRTASSPGNR
jgi:hypothetical protein